MKIRAITLGCDISYIENNSENLENILQSLKGLKHDLSKNGIETQSIRLATNPFTQNTHLNQNPFFKTPDIILELLDDYCNQGLINYYTAFSGLCDQIERLTETQQKLIKNIPALLSAHKNMFSSIQVASNSQGINFEAISLCSDLIKQNSNLDSFQNLRFAVLFNVPPNIPFFPSAYHLGDNLKISIALEAADEIVKITNEYCLESCNLDSIRKLIIDKFENICQNINDIIDPFCKQNSIIYEGIDLSPAQYPVKEKSIGTAIEGFGLSEFGELGTAFGIGFLTSALHKSKVNNKIGYSGFMQPLLEDYTIAKRHEEGKIDITKLLLNSCLCGLGLDTIPLPGNISKETIFLLLMDVAMISCRLNKPLTARLMPIKGKSKYEKTDFNFEYFHNTTICEIPLTSKINIEEFIRKNPSLKI